MGRAGSGWQTLSCLGPTVWKLSRASPAHLRWMFPSSSAAVFFPCACLAEHSHLAEGERGDVRNQALSSRGSRPTSGSLRLPWQTALATWLLEPLFLVPTSSQEEWYPGPCLGSLTLWMTGSRCCWRSQAVAPTAENVCKLTLHSLLRRAPGPGIQGLKCLSICQSVPQLAGDHTTLYPLLQG